MVPPLDLTSARDAEALQRALTGATDVSPEIARLAGTARSVASMPVPGPDASFVASLGARLAAEGAAPSGHVDTSAVPSNVISIRRTWPRAVAGTAAGLVAASTVLGIASQNALPGDLLYGVRGVVDGLEASVAGGDAARGRTLLAQGREHITDAEALAQRDPQSAADIITSLDDAAAAVTSGEEALFTAFDADRDPAHLAEVKDFTTWATPRLQTLERTLPPEARTHLAALTATVDAGEARLNAALASCGDDCASVTPIPATPGTVTPGTVTPGTVTPGTVTPGTVTTGAGTPAPSTTTGTSPATSLPGVVPLPTTSGLPTSPWAAPGVSPWTGLPRPHVTDPVRDQGGTTSAQTTRSTSQQPPTSSDRPTSTTTSRPSDGSHTALPTPHTPNPTRSAPTTPPKYCPDGSIKLDNCGKKPVPKPRPSTTTPRATTTSTSPAPPVSPTRDQQIDDAVDAARDALPVVPTSTTSSPATTSSSPSQPDATRCAVVNRLVGLAHQAGYPLMWERTPRGWTVTVVRHHRTVTVTDVDAACHS